MRAIDVPLTLLSLLLLSGLAGAYCDVGVQDPQLGAHVVIGTCRDIGTFSVGGLYNDTWERLSYYYPLPWKGTFLSVYAEGKIYSTSANPKAVSANGSLHMDRYVQQKPEQTEDGLYVSWMLPEGILVEETFQLVENGSILEVKLTNTGSRPLEAGARLHLDTMLGENDGAPIYIPGDGLKSEEVEYSTSELDADYWKAYNRLDNATLVATGVIRGSRLTYPDRIVVADWKKSMYTSWGYEIDPERTILGDSALLMYYEPRRLSPGETRVIGTMYAGGEPILSARSGSMQIADIVADESGGTYAPGENVSFSVDVASREAANDTSVLVEVLDKEGNVIYSYNVSTELLEEDSITPVRIGFMLPEDYAEDDFFDVRASVSHGGKIVDNESRRLQLSGVGGDHFAINQVDIKESGEGFNISVAVLSAGKANSGILRIQVMADGAVVYETAVDTGEIGADNLKVYDFLWLPGRIDLDSITVVVSLYRGTEKMDEVEQKLSFPFTLKDLDVRMSGKEVVISADLSSSKLAHRGELELNVVNQGQLIHESRKATGLVPPYMITTVDFTWTPPKNISGSTMFIVSLYEGARKIDEITEELPFKTSEQETPAELNKTVASRPQEADEDEEKKSGSEGTALSLLALIPLILIFVFLNPSTRGRAFDASTKLYGQIEEKSRGRGLMSDLAVVAKAVGISYLLRSMSWVREVEGVEIEKMRDGENVVIIIKNKSKIKLKDCVVEDDLPPGVEVLLSDIHVIGKGNRFIVSKDDKLLWHLGVLLPNDTSILEYKMKDRGRLPSAKLRWDSGEKTTR